MSSAAKRVAMIAALCCAAVLQGCSSKANILAAIDGPYIPPSERVAMAAQTSLARPPGALAEGPGQLADERAEPPALAVPASSEAAPESVAVATPLARPGGSELTIVGATGGGSYSSFFNHAIARLNASSGASGRSSVLLRDPPSLEPDLLPCGNGPPAVLLDLDPAGGLLPLARDSRAVSSLGGYLARLREAGVTVNWITGHSPEAASAIRAILRETGLDPAGTDPLIVSRFAGESKQDRRHALGETHCLLAIAGDRRADFDELYDYILEPVMAAPLEELVGNGWFLVPPPID